ncbi:MAG: nucleotidyltransferase family protein [Gallionellaceae bacterium]|nr:nucleotidyltransferase family protein [Gallionellaceae bacterium]
MEAIILAGGFGTRLRALVPDVPKPMAPIGGRPFLEILLTSLAHKGFSRVVLSLCFMAEKVTTYFGDEFAGMQLAYVIEDQPLGTGGAIRLAMGSCRSDHIYVFNGDTYLDLEVAAVEKQWQHHQLPLIVGREVPDTTRYGRLAVTDGKVCGFAEKGMAGAGLINAGCYILNAGQLDKFPLNTAFSLEADYLTQAVQRLPFELFVTQGKFIDIGVPEDYQRAQIELAQL